MSTKKSSTLTPAQKAAQTRIANKEKLAMIELLGGKKGDTLKTKDEIKEFYVAPFAKAAADENCSMDEDEAAEQAEISHSLGKEVIDHHITNAMKGAHSAFGGHVRGALTNRAKAGGSKTEEQLLASAQKAIKALSGDSKRSMLNALVAELGGTYVA